MKQTSGPARMENILAAQGKIQEALQLLSDSGAVEPEVIAAITAASVSVLEAQLERLFETLPEAVQQSYR